MKAILQRFKNTLHDIFILYQVQVI